MNRESNREARLCRRRLLYSQRMVAETHEQLKRSKIDQKKIKRWCPLCCCSCSSITAGYVLFRNMKLNAIAQSGSPPNVLHSPSNLIVAISLFLYTPGFYSSKTEQDSSLGCDSRGFARHLNYCSRDTHEYN